jgi:alpha-1,2-mannosyltransferase
VLFQRKPAREKSMDSAIIRPVKKIFISSLLKRGILFLNIGMGIVYIILWGYAAYQGMFFRADFTNFYTAGAIVRDGHGQNLYDAALQTQYQQQILNGLSFQDGILMYISPPQAVFPFVILSLLPLQTAFWVWSIIEVGLLACLLKLLRDLARDWPEEERLLMLSCVCAFPLLFITFMQGAFSLFVLVCMLQFYLTLKNRHEVKAGIWLAIGFLKPQNMILLLVLLVAARRWKTLASSAISGLILFAVTSLTLGWHIWLDFINQLAVYGNYFDRFGVAPEKMYNLKGTLTLILGSGQAGIINLVSWIALACAAGLVFILWLGPWQPEDANLELRLAVTFTLGLLFSTYLYAHDALLLVLPAELFVIYLRQRGLPLLGFGAFCLAAPYLFFIGEYVLEDRLYIRIAVLMMIALLTWLGLALAHDLRRAAGNVAIYEAK